MIMNDLLKKTPRERGEMLQELRLKIQSARFEASAGKKQNIKELKEAKKTIARLRTIEASNNE